MTPMPNEFDDITRRLEAAGPAPEPSTRLAERILAIPDEVAQKAENAPAVVPLSPKRRRLTRMRLAAVASVAAASIAAVLVFARPNGPGTDRELTFAANAGATVTGTATISNVRNSVRTVSLDVRGLEPVSDGFYQVWLSRSPEQRIAIGAVRPNGDGRVEVDLTTPALTSEWKAIWITREPDDGNPGWTEDWVAKGTFA